MGNGSFQTFFLMIVVLLGAIAACVYFLTWLINDIDHVLQVEFTRY